MASSKQARDVLDRLEYACVTNATQQTYKGVVVNPRSAIRLAFMLGVRFALAHPELAGDFMGRWIGDQTEGTDIPSDEMGKKHERAMHNIVLPMMFDAEEYEHIDSKTVEDQEQE